MMDEENNNSESKEAERELVSFVTEHCDRWRDHRNTNYLDRWNEYERILS